MNKEKITNIISITFISSVFIALLVYIFAVDGMHNVVNIFKSINYWWFVAGLLLTIVYWLLEGICFYVITKKIYKDQKFYSSFRLAMIGRLFNNITPFSSGDQPMQLIVMNKEGKSISNGVSILLTRFIIYQAVLILFTFVIMIFKYSYFENLLNNFIYFAILGFLINTLVIVFLILVAVNEKLIVRLVNKLLRFLHKIRVVKDIEKAMSKVCDSISDFNIQIQIFKKEKLMIFKVALYTFIEIVVLYSITYVVYRAFGQNTAGFITIFSAQAVLSLITVYMPTPGSSFAAEGGFYLVFKTFFPANKLAISILFWRIYTFYLPIIVGTIFLAMKPKSINKENNLNEEC